MYIISIIAALIIAVLSALYIKHTEKFDETYPYMYMDKATISMFLNDKLINIYGNNIDLLDINQCFVTFTMTYDQNKSVQIQSFELSDHQSLQTFITTILQESGLGSLQELRDKIEYAKMIISTNNKAIMTIIMSN